MGKEQLHKRFSDEQVRDIVGKYDAKLLCSKEACRFLGIGRTRLHQLVTTYRLHPEQKLVDYKRLAPTRVIQESVKNHILCELAFEKEKIIDNPDVPTNAYNYSYIRSLLFEKYEKKVSLPTIIALAKTHNFYKPKRKKEQDHTRVVLTQFVGELIQHDASPHLFAPDAKKKWSLITSIDDYSRKLLSAKLVLSETVWQHITSVEDVCLRFGIPFSYYVDQHSIFRYVKDRDKFSYWTTYTKFTGDVDTQWAALLKELSVKPIYALSPQAKGKIERPYQWLQDHLVRTCVRYAVTDVQKAQEILDEEVFMYNTTRIHSTTGEIPDIRFNKAVKEGKTLFRPFRIPQPYQTTRDIFALRAQRRTDGYRAISLFGQQLKVPKADPYMPIDVRYAPGAKEDTIDFRFWTEQRFLGLQTVPAANFYHAVHF
jgi:hypothetical protein